MKFIFVRFAASLLLAIGLTMTAASGLPAANADETGTGGDFVSVAYSRLFDTTVAGGTPFSAGETRSYQLLGTNGLPTTGVGAVVMDVTVWNTTATSSAPTGITVWPSGATRPSANMLKVDSSNQPRSNTVVVAPGSDGKISVYNSTGSTNINVDIQGYFTAASSSGAAPGGYVQLDSYNRVFYTDDGTGTSATKIANGETRTVSVAGVDDIPSNASAVFANIHVHDQTADGKIKLVPYGTDPNSVNPIVNYATGSPTDSGATLTLGSGKLTIQNVGNSPVDVAIDVEGYFTPDTTQGGGYHAVTATSLPAVTVPASGTASFQVGGQASVPMYGASGAMLNLTATGGSGSGLGYLKAYTAGQPEPNEAILGWTNGSFQPVSTSAAVRPGDSGNVTLRNTGSSPITITPVIEGWFAATRAVTTADETVYRAATAEQGESATRIEQGIYDGPVNEEVVATMIEAAAAGTATTDQTSYLNDLGLLDSIPDPNQAPDMQIDTGTEPDRIGTGQTDTADDLSPDSKSSSSMCASGSTAWWVDVWFRKKSLLGSSIYVWHHRVDFCRANGKVTKWLDRYDYLSQSQDQIKWDTPLEVNQQGGLGTSTAWSHKQRHLEACWLKYGCVANYHPWSKITVYGSSTAGSTGQGYDYDGSAS